MIFRLMGCLIWAILLGLPTAEAATQPPLMTMPGQFSVSPTGAATYTIPIQVPPGSAGMFPLLTLDYSSQNGDGIVGPGWSLAGLSSIARCPRTSAQDGIHGGVNYNANDRFCYEGQRLVPIGTCGASCTEYRTEVDSFARILAYGTAGNGPAYFMVWSKAGQIMEFGNTTDARILAVGTSTARTWALNKISDAKGNYLTVSYMNDSTNGQFYPTRIDYTGNANAGVAPYNSVRFVYDAARPDVTPTYQAGSLQQTTVLLTDIETFQGANLVYDYRLSYRAGSSTTHSRLISATLCDGSGSCPVPCNSSPHCLATTAFSWQGGTGALAMSGTPNGLAQANYLQSFIAGDFNGDGLTDVIVTNDAGPSACPAGGSIYFSTSAGSFVPGNMTMTGADGTTGPACFTSSIYPALVGDINGDGFSDVFMITSQSSPSGVTFKENSLLNNKAGSLNFVGLQNDWGNATADFNGDGRSDFYAQDPETGTYTYWSQGNGYFTQTLVPSPIQQPSSLAPADFDGDGCSDLLTQGATKSVTYFCSPAVSQVTTSNWSSYTIILGDFNGDGKTDVLLTSKTQPGILYLSTGTGVTATSFSVPSDWGKYQIVVGDWNGDGKTDIALIAPGGSGYYGVGTSHSIWLSTGSGFIQAATIPNTNPANTFVTAAVADWNNDGSSALWLQMPSGNMIYTFSYAPELLTSISNGVGAATTISYDRLNKNGGFYQKCSSGTYDCGDTYPTQSIDSALYSVSRVDTSNGIGGLYSSTYAYGGAKADLFGYGFLGFSFMTTTDLQTGIVQTTNYRMEFPFTGKIASQAKTLSGVTLASIANTFLDTNLGAGTDGVVRHLVSLSRTVMAANDLNGTALPTTQTDYTYDSYGNALAVNASVYNPHDGTTSQKNTTNTYLNDTANWFLGRLLTTSVNSTVGASNIIRQSSFTYDAGTGLLTQETIEPGVATCNGASCTLNTSYTYDAFGHRATTTVYGSGITTRTSYAFYDSLGQFETSATNALSQHESWTYDPRFGGIASHTDPNSVTTGWTYDSFGRLIQEVRSDGTKTNQSYAYCSGGCPTYGAFYSQSEMFAPDGTTQIGAISTAYYDMLSRTVANDTQGFDGRNVRVATAYDVNARIQQTSRPYFTASASPAWTQFLYDPLGRVTTTTFPDASHTSNGYNGLVTTVTNNLSQATVTTRNAQGLNASVRDATGNTTVYVYDAFGNLATVTDPAGNVITNLYDVRGNKTDSYDPDMGHWTYVHDVLGDLTSQTDAKGQTTTLTYDLLGRTTGRVEPDMTSNWTYDTAAHGIGRLATAVALPMASGPGLLTGYVRTMSYDTLGRPSQTVIAQGPPGGPFVYVFTYTTTYDANGYIGSVTHPSGFVVNNSYNSYGYLSQVRDGSSTLLWQANAADAEFHVTQHTFGNGITGTDSYDANTGFLTGVRAGPGNSVAAFDFGYDTLGNLTYRADEIQGVTEYACYDTLNRLVQSAAGAGVTACGSALNQKSASYDALGNITYRSDVGTYSYPAAGQPLPHAVASIAGTVGGVVNPTYSYDANGNMTSGAGRTITYNSFNMVQTVVQGTAKSVLMRYDPEHRLVKRDDGPFSSGTVYLNDPASGEMSEYFVGPGNTTWHDFIQANGQIVAEKFSGTDNFMRYLTRDSLGSIAVVTDENAIVSKRNAYGAWGQSRNLDGSDPPSCVRSSHVNRDFTGQEYFQDICLLNLNARLYDPAIGRFLTSDSIVPNTYDGQSFNRYAYVTNNPLSLVDPTGHDVESVTVTGYGPGSSGANQNLFLEFAALGSGAPVSQFAPFRGSVAVTASSALSPGQKPNASGLPLPTLAKTDNSAALDRQADGTDTSANSSGDDTDAAQNTGKESPPESVTVHGIRGTNGGLTQVAANGTPRDAIQAVPSDAQVAGFLGAAATVLAPELKGLKVLYDWLNPSTGNTYNFTNTVEGNAATRPYINSPLTIQQIERTGQGVADPGGLPGALRYDVPGSYNGSNGTYQLVIDPKTNTVYHFLFTGK